MQTILKLVNEFISNSAERFIFFYPMIPLKSTRSVAFESQLSSLNHCQLQGLVQPKDKCSDSSCIIKEALSIYSISMSKIVQGYSSYCLGVFCFYLTIKSVWQKWNLILEHLSYYWLQKMSSIVCAYWTKRHECTTKSWTVIV